MALGTLQGLAWGQKGHDVTAAIAERHLTPTAAARVSTLLDGRSPIYWANWLDNASHTPEYAYSKTWHYRNIDAGQDYDRAPRNPAGDVVTAIQGQMATLSDKRATREDRQLALRILIHCVGDLHQPMHMGHLSDLGGNKWPVKVFGRDKNLHGAWDSDVVENAHKWSYSEWADQLDRLTEEQVVEIVGSGQPEEWGRETFGIATTIYDTTPKDYNLSYNYFANWSPTVEKQLLRGGVRLAHLLNTLFDPTYRAGEPVGDTPEAFGE